MRLFRARRKPAGLAPGTPVFVGEQRVERPRISVFDYDDSRCDERELTSVDECRPLRDSPTVTWLNLDGVHDTALVEKLGECFGLHPLVVEDIVNTTQRPKLDDYGDNLYLAVRMFRRGPDGELLAEQVSIVLGTNFVLSFQEQPGDVFDPVRTRLREHKGRVRGLGADYLCYALLDAIVDNLFAVLEPVGDRIEDLEDQVTRSPEPATLHSVHELKRELVHLRKSVWPLREVAGGLERVESELVRKETAVFLRDVHDHTVQVIDAIETSRETIAGLLDIYLSSVSNRMNEVMKVLTIIATIFIPLTFIAGIYGMNFHNMPELGWRWAYFAVLGLMAVVALGMVLYFKRKKWL